MRVLFVSDYPHLPEILGGLQTTTHDLCQAIETIGAEAAVLCGISEQGGVRAALRDDSLGYPVFRTNDPGQALAMIALAWGATSIVVQSGVRLAPMVLGALETGLPTAVYLHNVESHQVGGVLIPDPTLLYLANSSFTAERWKALNGLDCAVIPPVINGEKYSAEKTGDHVLFVNPTPIKGVEIMFSLAAACPDIPFLVAESWNLEPTWRDLCRLRAETAGNIRWTAATLEMRSVYAQSRALLMPSLWEEAYGRTAIEAQLNGLPVLASRRGALPDTIGDGGLLVDAHAPIDQWRTELFDLLGPAYPDFSRRAINNAMRAVAKGPLNAGRLLSLLAAHAER